MEIKGKKEVDNKINLTTWDINDWLTFANWSVDYGQDLGDWRTEYNVESNKHKYSAKALQAWTEKIENQSSKLPAYKQKHRWIYKKVGKCNKDIDPKLLLLKVLKIPKALTLLQQKRHTKQGMKIGKLEKVKWRP